MRKETRVKDGVTYHLRHYNDWLDLVSYAEQIERGQRNGCYGGLECASVRDRDTSWSGTETLTEAIELARRGWAHGRERVRDVRRFLDITKLLPNSHRIQITRDVSGDEPDVELYLRGEPENMMTLWESQIAQRGKVVRFILSRSALGDVDSEQIIRRGVGLMLAFEVLIQLGYSPDVMISFGDTPSGGRGGARFEWFVPVLHAGDPINLDTLAFMFIQPAVLRRLHFAARECEPKELRAEFGFYGSEGYGHSCDPEFLPEHDLFLGWREGLQLWTTGQIIQFTLDILRRVGIELREQS